MKKYFILAVIITGFLAAPFASANTNTLAISEKELQAFCTDKPIWSAFAIEPDTCLSAATACAAKAVFTGIDPIVLSEPFYQCVFKKLGIDIN
jgi:hypothetical protein